MPVTTTIIITAAKFNNAVEGTVNRHYYTEPTTMTSVNKHYYTEPTTMTSVNKHYYTEPTTMTSVNKHYYTEPTTMTSVNKHYHTEPTTMSFESSSEWLYLTTGGTLFLEVGSPLFYVIIGAGIGILILIIIILLVAICLLTISKCRSQPQTNLSTTLSPNSVQSHVSLRESSTKSRPQSQGITTLYIHVSIYKINMIIYTTSEHMYDEIGEQHLPISSSPKGICIIIVSSM